MKNKEKEKEEGHECQKFTITLDRHEMKILAKACDVYSRLICGQMADMEDICEQAWRRMHQEEGRDCHGEVHDYDYDYDAMRRVVEDTCYRLKKLCWGCERNAHYGIKYDETSDLLFDMRKSMEYALWDTMEPEHKKALRWSVVTDGPMGLTKYPELIIKPIENNNNDETDSDKDKGR